MVWGCMAANGDGDLVFIEEIMNKMSYFTKSFDIEYSQIATLR